MEYGLKRYEAIQRLLWFVFFLFCLTASYVTQDTNRTAPVNVQLRDMKSAKFWTGFHGLLYTPPSETQNPRGKVEPADPGQGQDARRPSPFEKRTVAPPPPAAEPGSTDKDPQYLGRTEIFLIRAGVIFILGRLIWLLVQYFGRYLLKCLLEDCIKSPGPIKQEFGRGPVNPELLFPKQLLIRTMQRIPLNFIFHPFMRLKLILSGQHNSVSSEDLLEKERRIVDTDWSILYRSWGPFRWMLWLLPALALVQTAWLFFLQIHGTTISQKEILDTVQTIPNALLPLVQAAGLVVFFKLVSGLLARMEDLYLSNLDSLIYDRLLSRLPFQSNDTLIILDTLQRQFHEIREALKNMERPAAPVRKKYIED